MSRSRKRLRRRARFLELRMAVLELLRDKLTRDVETLSARLGMAESELRRWKPRVSIEHDPKMQATALKIYVMDDVIKHAVDPRSVLEHAIGDLRSQLTDHYSLTRRLP